MQRLVGLGLAPGVLKDASDREAEGRFIDSQWVRFRAGQPETIGGYEVYFANPDPEPGVVRMVGIPRNIFTWADNDGAICIAVGTTKKVYVIQSGTLADVTPIRKTSTSVTDPFSVTSGDETVTVNDTAHGCIVGSRVTISGATDSNGLTYNGEVEVTEVVDADNWRYEETTAATGTSAATGGSVDFDYDINPGNASGAVAGGWGTGTWGTSTWGTARTVASGDREFRTWSLDNWGEDLLLSPINDTIFHWDTSAGGRATEVSNAPSSVKGFIVSQQARHIMAFGTVTDLMQVEWCSSEDETTWSPSSTNSAGDMPLEGGSKLVAGLSVGSYHLFWSDTSLFGATYRGDQFVFSFEKLGENCAPVGPMAIAEYNGSAFWMGRDGFFWWNGSEPQRLESSVERHVFDNLITALGGKVICDVNPEYGEVWWFYPASPSSVENSHYVILNVREGTWYVGEFKRTAFHSSAHIKGPISMTEDGDVATDIFRHEVGANDPDGNAIAKWIESGAQDIGDGSRHTLVGGIVPEFRNRNGDVEVTVYIRNWPTDPEVAAFTATVTNGGDVIKERARGRQVRYRLESNTAGGRFRLGTMRMFMDAAGARWDG